MAKSLDRTLIKDTLENVDKQVLLKGWVATKRDHGKLTFIDLRDRTGIVQCVGFGKMGELSVESVVEIVGTVKKRPERMINPHIETGTVEVSVDDYKILNKAEEMPNTKTSGTINSIPILVGYVVVVMCVS